MLLPKLNLMPELVPSTQTQARYHPLPSSQSAFFESPHPIPLQRHLNHGFEVLLLPHKRWWILENQGTTLIRVE